MHRNGHVPSSSRCALAAQGVGHRGAGRHSAQHAARGGGRGEAGRAARVQHVHARVRGERRSDRGVPARESRVDARATARGNRSSARARRWTLARAPPASWRRRCVRRSSPEDARVRWRGGARRAIPYVIAATAGFVFSYLIVAFFVFPATIIPSDRKVPNVVGMTYDDAAKRLTTDGFRSSTGEQRFHASAPAGTVLEQDPPAGSVEGKGAEIVLHVSSGQRRGEVPNVVGMTRQQAELAIENAGLDVGDVEEIRANTPRGTVSASRPVAGSRVTVPSSVTRAVIVGPLLLDLPLLLFQDSSR